MQKQQKNAEGKKKKRERERGEEEEEEMDMHSPIQPRQIQAAARPRSQRMTRSPRVRPRSQRPTRFLHATQVAARDEVATRDCVLSVSGFFFLSFFSDEHIFSGIAVAVVVVGFFCCCFCSCRYCGFLCLVFRCKSSLRDSISMQMLCGKSATSDVNNP